MKRRLFAIMLALAMLCPMVLTGCGGGAEPTETGDTALNDETIREKVSITMWVVTDKKTTEEAQAAVEEAFNDYLQSNNYCTKKNYMI